MRGEERLFDKRVLGTALLVSFVVICFMAVGTRPSHAQGTTVSIVPASATVGVGKEVVINLTVTNIAAPGVFSYQVTIAYDNTVLTATQAAIPADQFLKPSNPANIFVVDPGTINQTLGIVTFGATLLGAEAGKTGSGTLATVHFQGAAEGNSTIQIKDLILVDPNTESIPSSSYTVENGTISVQAAPVTPGDVNGDGNINIQDMVAAATSFRSVKGDARYNPAADQNKDGVIDIRDFVLIAIAWNNSLKG